MSSSRIRELDGLRAIAAIGVAFYHIHPQGTFWMWSFVDLFFVLSGYLITGILLRLEHWDAVSLRNFWVRRILRIWPVYYLTLLGVLLLWFAWQHKHGHPLGWFSGFRESVVFLQYLVGDYPRLPEGTNYLWWFGHSWSLAVEEQFYLLWPLLLWAFRRKMAVCAAVLASFLALVLWTRYTTAWPQYLLLTRGDGLALGSLLAVIGHAVAIDNVPAPVRKAGRWLPLATLAIAATLLFPYFQAGYSGADVAGWARSDSLPLYFALAYGSLVGLLLTGSIGVLNRLLGLRPLAYLGSLSYAIYMFHLPIQKLLDQFYNAGVLRPRLLVEALFWVAVLGLAAISRIVLEKPMERVKARFPLRFLPSHKGQRQEPGDPAAEPQTAA